MADTQRIVAMRETLQFLVSSDVPTQHKSVLVAALSQALRDEADAQQRQQAMRRVSAEWLPEESSAVEAFLKGKVARGWQHADELVMRLASQLHRSPADIRAKAIELGLGASVDYRLAKVITAAAND